MQELKSVKKVLNYFPMLSAHLEEEKIDENQELNQIERVFLDMCKFFRHPSTNSFDVNLIYRNLDVEWVPFAFDCLQTFFREDTYLWKKDDSFTVYKHDPLLNQVSFAKYLTQHGLSFDKRKINVYKSRGKLPETDATIEGNSYWLESTIASYLEARKNGQNDFLNSDPFFSYKVDYRVVNHKNGEWETETTTLLLQEELNFKKTEAINVYLVELIKAEKKKNDELGLYGYLDHADIEILSCEIDNDNQD